MEARLNAHEFGYVRIACAAPALAPADVTGNLDVIRALVRDAAQDDVRFLVLPELCLTGYSCADLFHDRLLQDHALAALRTLAADTARFPLVVLAGAPIRFGGRLFNCAAVLAAGNVLGLVPKTYLPATNEYYEPRWFASAREVCGDAVELFGETIPFGADLLFRVPDRPDITLGVELCEDLWAVEPPSGPAALAGATIIANLSASVELLGKAAYRRDLVRMQSARCLAAYAYAGAGPGESTTDVVFSGHCLIAENGAPLAESDRFSFAPTRIVADVDVQLLESERERNSSFRVAPPAHPRRGVELPPWSGPIKPPLRRTVSRTPFIPEDLAKREADCMEIVRIQSAGLGRRLLHVGLGRVVLGVSGGVDSTLALLVCVEAFDRLGLPRANIRAVAMPGFGTTDRTRCNAEQLAQALGVAYGVIPIHDAVLGHFRDIGQDPERRDLVYENAQARERMQILMDLANKHDALVVGSGNLSEAALGWCTYNGDHMSMYHVNKGVPKTLIRLLVSWCADHRFDGLVRAILHDVVATPVSPELLPPGPDGEPLQRTEDLLGPYELHDFFLHQVIRRRFPPRKIFHLATTAFKDVHSPTAVLDALDCFLTRFFSQQFKRSADPDGPKVGSVALSPRGDWRMPSDASPALWKAEIARLRAELTD